MYVGHTIHDHTSYAVQGHTMMEKDWWGIVYVCRGTDSIDDDHYMITHSYALYTMMEKDGSGPTRITRSMYRVWCRV